MEMTKKEEKKSEYLVLDLPEIDYESTEDRAILRGKYMGEDILIYYYGQTGHPCAYLKVKKIPEDIEMLDVPCNGGITFNNEITEDTKWNGGRFTEGFWIGWDYAHCDDYMRILGRGKKWTTEEILKEVEDVISLIRLIKYLFRLFTYGENETGYKVCKYRNVQAVRRRK